MIRFVDLQKSYNGQEVLHIPFLTLEKGIYWLKGYNGSGKTTLLKIIAALIPFGGDVQLRSISLKKDPIRYRGSIGWAEAEPLFPEFITGSELIRLYASIKLAPTGQAQELIQLFRMTDYINNKVRTYSSGMQKKLAIVLALLGNSELVLLDEPLITLDAESVETLIRLVNEYHDTKGINFILSSHVEPDSTFTAGHKRLLVNNHTLTVPA